MYIQYNWLIYHIQKQAGMSNTQTSALGEFMANIITLWPNGTVWYCIIAVGHVHCIVAVWNSIVTVLTLCGTVLSLY